MYNMKCFLKKLIDIKTIEIIAINVYIYKQIIIIETKNNFMIDHSNDSMDLLNENHDSSADLHSSSLLVLLDLLQTHQY